MKNEGAILDHLRSAIACVYGGLADQALHHLDAARLEIAPRKIQPAIGGHDARVVRGLNELRDRAPNEES